MPTAPPRHQPPGTRPAQDRAKAYDQHRGSAASRGYDRAWQRLRRAVLAEEPLCRHCRRAGLLPEANEVHHVQPVARRPELRLERANLVPLCKPCHSAETAREQAGH